MKKLWFLVFLVFLFFVVLFFKQETIKKKVEIDKPDSKVGKKIDEAMGLGQLQHLDRAKKVGAQGEFNTIKTAFVMYYTTYGEYPKSLEELVDKRMMGRDALTDFWRQGYRTEIEGTDLVLTSPGPDRIKNTKDDIATRISLIGGGKGEVEWTGRPW